MSVGLAVGSLCRDRWVRRIGGEGEGLVVVADMPIVLLLRREFDCLEGIRPFAWGLYYPGVVDHGGLGHQRKDILDCLVEGDMLDHDLVWEYLALIEDMVCYPDMHVDPRQDIVVVLVDWVARHIQMVEI